MASSAEGWIFYKDTWWLAQEEPRDQWALISDTETIIVSNKSVLKWQEAWEKTQVGNSMEEEDGESRNRSAKRTRRVRRKRT